MSAARDRTRLSVYALALEGRSILLTQGAEGHPGAGTWSLPGGGLAWGEHPIDALHRELYEETGLRGTVDGLLGINSFVFGEDAEFGLSPLHAVRVVYRMTVSGSPRVVEQGGTTGDARWFDLSGLGAVPVGDLVEWALQRA